eukprot:15492413-Heterocapsa_arctica.AAC.1
MLKEAQVWPGALNAVLSQRQEDLSETVEEESNAKWHVLEYCCEPDSLLSEWFLRHGQEATRLGLPEWDLRTEKAARRVVELAKDTLAKGRHVLLWASLPCTAWCSWQRVNMQLGEKVVQKVNMEREESLGMVHLFLK